MSTKVKEQSAAGVKATGDSKRAATGNGSALGKGQTGETNRRAAAVLEVLAGVRTPAQAAEALGLSVNYYYVLERKALGGLLAACAPQVKGPPGPSCEQQLARKEQELEKCRQECLRQASLVRAAERAIGLAALPTSSRRSRRKTTSPADGGAKKRRRRRPTVRALRAVRTLQQNSSLESAAAGVQTSSADGQSTTKTDVATGKESGDGTGGPQAAGDGAR
jgi:hypothetical protein